MRASPVVCLLCAAALAACGSTSSGGGGAAGVGEPISIAENAPSATGNVMVTIRTWNRNADAGNPPPTDAILVNASSEIGKRQAAGKTYPNVRVLPDEDMGKVLATLDQEGFSGRAREGLTIKGLTEDMRRRGVIVVDRDGHSKGLEYYPGTADADLFRRLKVLLYQVHNAVGGFEVRASTNPDEDPERTFQAPKARLRR